MNSLTRVEFSNLLSGSHPALHKPVSRMRAPHWSGVGSTLTSVQLALLLGASGEELKESLEPQDGHPGTGLVTRLNQRIEIEGDDSSAVEIPINRYMYILGYIAWLMSWARGPRYYKSIRRALVVVFEFSSLYVVSISMGDSLHVVTL
jgi:hypothetical protein